MLELGRIDGRVMRIGHRGAPALAPENTLRSLELAAKLGVDMVEFDVLDLHGGELVLAHSDDLLEVSHGAAAGRVRAQSLAELRSVVPELPTLEEALGLFAERLTGVALQVDLKWIEYEGRVVRALQEHGLVERTLVSSFHASSLRRVRAREPGLRTSLTYPEDRHGVTDRRVLAPFVRGGLAALRTALPRRIGALVEAAGASAATLHHSVVSRALVERCAQLGLPVLVWTVDDALLRERLEALGVAGIITNDPRIFSSLKT